MNILFVGDVFGKPGREALLRWLPGFTEEHAVDFVIANGENAANGAGITSKIAERLLAGGRGRHHHRQPRLAAEGGLTFLATDERIVRPANYPPGAPGRGLTVRPAADGDEVAVINLAGELFLQTGMSPFRIVDRLVDEAQQLAETIVVDLHAEATSEKVAMGHYLDGRVTAVLGTHTHVQTSDARVLPGGTAYMTDVGMTGPRDSVIGVRTDIILRRFTTELPQAFEVAEGPVRLDAALIAAEGGRATRHRSRRRHPVARETGGGAMPSTWHWPLSGQARRSRSARLLPADRRVAAHEIRQGVADIVRHGRRDTGRERARHAPSTAAGTRRAARGRAARRAARRRDGVRRHRRARGIVASSRSGSPASFDDLPLLGELNGSFEGRSGRRASSAGPADAVLAGGAVGFGLYREPGRSIGGFNLGEGL